MRMRVRTEEEANNLSKHFDESHVEVQGDKIYLVVDRVKKKPNYA